MESKILLNKLDNYKKGTYIKLVKSKDLGQGVEKLTTMVVRLGVEYSHMKATAGKEVGKLPWGEWLSGYETMVITHKGAYYLRVANSYTKSSTSIYYLNGEEITKEKATELVGEKKLVSHSSDVYNIKFENIISLG